MLNPRWHTCALLLSISLSSISIYPTRRVGMSCALLLARVVLSHWLWRDRARSCRWWCCLPCSSALAGWRNFTHLRIYPSRFRWRPSCAWQQRLPNAGTASLRMRLKRLRELSSRGLTRRNCMLLDLIVVVVTIVSFVAFIYFTEACERL